MDWETLFLCSGIVGHMTRGPRLNGVAFHPWQII